MNRTTLQVLGFAAMLPLTIGRAATAAEFIFEDAPFPSCHASTIVELNNGDLMSAWFGGTAEGRPDVAIWGSRRTGSGWSKPAELAREPNIATFNPVLFHTKDNLLWLYYKFGPKPDNWTGARAMSTDEGKTWSAIEHLPAGLHGPIRAKPLVMADGTVVSGTSVESYRSWACWIERSVDNGKTFQRIGPITVPARDAPATASKGSHGVIQPSVVSLGGKRLRLYARSTLSIGKIVIADSSDAGLTWTDARLTNLPNPNSGIDAVALRDGRVVTVYNHTAKGRSPLNLAVSRDGEHFEMFRALETEPGEYSYPAMIQGKNGDLHITYTWQRKRIRYVRVAAAEIP
ncbi:MAG: sialidase family protein [Bryobacteraceae bacterium]